MSSSVRDITESTEAEGRDDTHQESNLITTLAVISVVCNPITLALTIRTR